jgi:2-hydroxychromene-2-carboxylate isomerase
MKRRSSAGKQALGLTLATKVNGSYMNGQDVSQLEFFFDCSSPWTYLGFENVQAIAADFDVAVEWRPILVGGIFNTTNPSVYDSRKTPVPAKAKYMEKDLADWALMSGLTLRFPPSVFPVNSVKAMRACIALQHQEKLVTFAREVFRAYWAQDLDISQDRVLHDVCLRAGADPDWVFGVIENPEIKNILRRNTEELVRRGFGSPTIFVNHDDMYFGNDRLPLVRYALERAARIACDERSPRAECDRGSSE